MSKYTTPEAHRAFRSQVLLAAATLFLKNGYSNSGTRGIAKAAGVNVSTMNKEFGVKENILCELVSYVLNSQFKAATKFIAGRTEDPVLYYAAETILQLYMAESNEAVRELYSVAYTLPKTSELIRRAVTEKLVSRIFRSSLPELSDEDYYLRELASGGIIRSYMTLPCSESFTMDKKVAAFLENALRIYDVPKEKIKEAIEFVKQFDYPTLAKETIATMFSELEKETQQAVTECAIEGYPSIMV